MYATKHKKAVLMFTVASHIHQSKDKMYLDNVKMNWTRQITQTTLILEAYQSWEFQ